MGELHRRTSRQSRRRTAALLLAVVLALVTVVASRPATPVGGWLPATTSLSEAPRGSSSPADRVPAGTLSDLGYASTPVIDLPPARPPSVFRVCWRQTDGCRPGHRHRIDRPPRLAV